MQRFERESRPHSGPMDPPPQKADGRPSGLFTPLSISGSTECARALLREKLGEPSYDFAVYVNQLIFSGLYGAGPVVSDGGVCFNHPLDIAEHSQSLIRSDAFAPCFWRSAGDFFLYYTAFPEALPRIRTERSRVQNFRELYPLEDYAQPYYSRAASALITPPDSPGAEQPPDLPVKVLLALADRAEEVVAVLPLIWSATIAAAK